jgi:hypothetical protein
MGKAYSKHAGKGDCIDGFSGKARRRETTI